MLDFMNVSKADKVFCVPDVIGDLDMGCLILDEISDVLGEYSIRAKGESQKSWKASLCDGVGKGAGRAHSWTRMSKAWRPTTTLSAQGAVLADPKS